MRRAKPFLLQVQEFINVPQAKLSASKSDKPA